MGAKSNIEWTDATWNPILAVAKEGEAGRSTRGVLNRGWHCEHVSEGCRNCYAEGINRRLGTGLDFKPGNLDRLDIFLDEKLLTDPLRWKKPRSVFLSSMTDIGAHFVSDAMLDRMFVVMALTPQHFYRVLTKRPDRMRAYIEQLLGSDVAPRGFKCPPMAALLNRVERDWMAEAPQYMEKIRPLLLAALDRLGVVPDLPLRNVGLGVSVEDQASADERIPHLLATPAAMRFVSCEPLLGPVDLTAIRREVAPGFFGDCLRWHHRGKCHEDEGLEYPCIDEVITGGESAQKRENARPMHPDWVRSLREQCAEAGTAFFFKQWGEWLPGSHAYVRGLNVDDCPLGEFHGGKDWIAACMCSEGDPDMPMFCVGKKSAGHMLDGREHREIAPQVKAHFEKFAPHPKNPKADFSTSPQGGGEGSAEGEAG